MKNFQTIFLGAIITIFFAGCTLISQKPATTFQECVDEGNPVMESYPRQCRSKNGDLFVEQVSGPDETACTLDAKLCPDGSSVGRIPPECEFAACPNEITSEKLPYTAQFEIYTRGTLRTFNQSMYLNQSEKVYIKAGDSSRVYVNASGITWQDFFDTLPFSVSYDCLITGDGEKLCSDQEHQLTFILNGTTNANVLNQVIQPKDELVVEYR